MKNHPDEPVDSNLHSRDQEEVHLPNNRKNKDEEEPMDSDESEDDKNIMCGVMSKTDTNMSVSNHCCITTENLRKPTTTSTSSPTLMIIDY